MLLCKKYIQHGYVQQFQNIQKFNECEAKLTNIEENKVAPDT